MAKTFYIMDTFLLPTGYNHMFMVRKIARGFAYNGFKVKVVRKIEEINDPGFIMTCDQPVYYSLGARNNSKGDIRRIIPGAIDRVDKFKLIRNISLKLQHEEYKKLALQIKNRDIVVLGWFTYFDKKFFDDIKVNIIHMGEYFRGRPLWKEQLKWWKFYTNKKNNAFPLRFAADVDPNKIGVNCSNEKYFVSFVGDKLHHTDFYSLFLNDPKCKIVPTPPYISEIEKRNIYRNSTIGLGLHHEQNIVNRMVAERVFEILAYGGVCLTDHPDAPKATDNCAIFVKSKKELRDLIKKFKNNKDSMEELRKRGFKFTKKYGTWTARAKEIINFSKNI